MSLSLVSRGLELFDADIPETNNVKKTEGKSAGVGTQRHGVQRAAKQRKRAQQKQQEAKKQLIQKQVVSALEEYSKYTNIDHTNDNIKLLKKIDRRKAPSEYVDQITQHHSKELERKGGNRNLALEHQKRGNKNKKAEETSVFSDEDFTKLNKEWLRLY